MCVKIYIFVTIELLVESFALYRKSKYVTFARSFYRFKPRHLTRVNTLNYELTRTNVSIERDLR